MDVIQVQAGLSDFLFVDQVNAALKPTADLDGHSGIKIQGGSGNTLRLEAGDTDTQIEVIDTTSAIEVIDTANSITASTFYTGGVINLELRTNDVQATRFRGDQGSGAEGTDVYVESLSSGIHPSVDTGAGTWDRITLGDEHTLENR